MRAATNCRCPVCNQKDEGQTGEYPCVACGLPLLHDTGARERFFFDSDGDGHWYKVPERLRGLWEQMTANDPETDEEIDAFIEAFDEFMLPGDISRYSFTDPRES